MALALALFFPFLALLLGFVFPAIRPVVLRDALQLDAVV
jgi:hypothetical protein